MTMLCAAPVRDGWALVAKVQAGDTSAFGEIYDLYIDDVFRFIRSRVRTRELAEDLTAETFLRALRAIGTVQPQGRDLVGWLLTIARNLIFDNSKAAATRRVDVVDPADLPSGQVPSSEDRALVLLDRSTLNAAVAELPERQRTCVMLRFNGDLSISETADVLGLTEGAVKSLQVRALRTLRRRLERTERMGRVA